MVQVGLLVWSYPLLPTLRTVGWNYWSLALLLFFVKGKGCRDGVYVAFGTLVGVPPECLLAFVTYLGARALR